MSSKVAKKVRKATETAAAKATAADTDAMKKLLATQDVLKGQREAFETVIETVQPMLDEANVEIASLAEEMKKAQKDGTDAEAIAAAVAGQNVPTGQKNAYEQIRAIAQQGADRARAQLVVVGRDLKAANKAAVAADEKTESAS